MESDIVENILKERYYQPGETCWEDIAKRVSDFIGNDETERKEFFEIINSTEFIPNSPCLMNAGSKDPLMSACFSIGIDDDLESIFNALKRGALLMKAGAGVGYDFSTLRPKDALIRDGQGTASGVVSFMRVFNSMIGEVKSGFKRRGAAISILRCDHPEIFEFIKCKDTEGNFSNFNISVMITNEFLDAVKNNLPWDLKFNNEIYKTVDATELFNEMIKHTHGSGEPGYLHYDNINKMNPNKHLGNITSCNPCITGDTKILTKEYGNIAIADVANENVTIWNGFEWSEVIPQVTGIDQEVMTISVRIEKEWEGKPTVLFGKVTCTPYHKFIMADGSRKCASELKIFDNILPWDEPFEEDTITNVSIEKITTLGRIVHKVYCLNESKNHSFIANGIMVGNCGEIPILVDPKTNGGESCNLGSIDVSKFFDEYQVDFTKLEKVVRLATRFLNNVMDKNVYPFDSIKDMTLATRKIGIGCMGIADLLIKMEMAYGSEESCEFCEYLMKFINDTAIDESKKMALDLGEFPAWGGSYWDKKGIKIRNSVLTCQAPTGSISLFADCSSGIEPNFGYVYKRSTWVDGEKKSYNMIHPLFKKIVLDKYQRRSNAIIDHILREGTISNCSYINEDLKKIFVTAKDVPWKGHCDMQVSFQKYTGNSISKTLNLPNKTTIDEVRDIIYYAFENGCKGLTIYREGSRKDVVLETNATKKDESKVIEVTNPVQYKLATANGRILPKTPRDMPATVHKRTTACGKLYVIPAEAFDQLHSLFLVNKGGCDAMTQVIAELIGSMCRFGIPRWEITRICSGIVCPACRNKRKLVDGNSCADIIARVILENYPVDEEPPKCSEEPTEDTTEIITINKVPCPKCGEALIMQEGCRTCPSCGYSKCS